METINWKVEGMSCTACAQSVDGFLRRKGMDDVNVSLTTGEVNFRNQKGLPETELKKGIEGLGYHVADKHAVSKPFNKFLRYLLVCVPFTAILQLHMIGHLSWLHWLMNPWVQLLLCLPVYVTGMYYFGRSALASIRNGPLNMNVLIALGATAAFVYSLAGTLLGLGESYLFYETSAAIITLVFFGNYLEERSLRFTRKALGELVKTQETKANMIAFDDKHQELIFPVDSRKLRSGDLVLVRSGEQVPADARILWGEGLVDESILTGESLPLTKKAKDRVIGGSMLTDGTLKLQVSADAGHSVLNQMVELVKRTQGEKPAIQKTADRISAVFVPVVLIMAVICFLLNFYFTHQAGLSVMRSIAVLVIACPCAMGLATPAAVAVGLGRGARNGILFRKADSLELFKKIKQVVFDKTGTLTNGSFTIGEVRVLDAGLSEKDFRRILYSLEKYSAHPIARSIAREWVVGSAIPWKQTEEVKGQGIRATSPDGTIYMAGTASFTGYTGDDQDHAVYLKKNEQILGWVDLRDELRPEAHAVVDYFKKRGIKTILLSGDRPQKCIETAKALGMDEVYGGQSPVQKLELIERMSAAAVTAMVGDGINDAPALAKASVSLSMSDASQLAMQTADVVLMNSGLKKLPLAIELGRQTLHTIRQNLFWAFFYNVLAIPIAAFGLLSPSIAAGAMAFSDLVLLANSSRLFVKKLL